MALPSDRLGMQSTGLILPVGALSNSQISRLRESFLKDPVNTDLSELRPVIARSWQRSLACNVGPGANAFVEASDPRVDEQLLVAAEPVLTELERLCTDSGASVVLTDAEGTLAVFRGAPAEIQRAERLFPTVGARMSEELIGTNSDGTVLEEGEAVQVWGEEHFNEALHNSYCTSVPIRDPIRRSTRGVIGIMLPEHVARDTSARSILLLVQGAAAEITRRLAERLAAREQALLSEYMREARKRGADAVVAMDDRTTIASRSALTMLGQSDFAVLGALAREASHTVRTVEHTLNDGTGREVRLHVRTMDLAELGAGNGAIMRVQMATERNKLIGRPAQEPHRELFPDLVGTAAVLGRAKDASSTAVTRHMPAYIVGEHGTGKRLLAESMAARLSEDVVVFDCHPDNQTTELAAQIDTALAQGAAVVIHRADRCPVEAIEEITALLHVLEQPQVVITLTTLTDEVTPLLSALRGIEVTMPPLRSRRGDIEALARHFLTRLGEDQVRLSAKLRDALVSGDWPGNVRQLRDVIETTAQGAAGSELRLSDLSEVHLRMLSTSRLTRLEEAELPMIRSVLAECAGNRVRAATMLGISRSTLYRKIETYEARGFDLELG